MELSKKKKETKRLIVSSQGNKPFAHIKDTDKRVQMILNIINCIKKRKKYCWNIQHVIVKRSHTNRIFCNTTRTCVRNMGFLASKKKNGEHEPEK